tara:strand:- start:290 stop:580 length:291 start_codon:yes stop_codon:yes gene_type:complete
MTLDSVQLKELETAIADSLFIKVEKWNLYLGDAGLAMDLAIECKANISQGAELSARKGLESVEVGLGSGDLKLPLARLVPSSQIFDLQEILEPYCR